MGEFISFINFLQSVGFTKESTIPLVFIALIAYIIFTNKLSKITNPIKLAIVEIQTIFRNQDIPIQHSLTEGKGSPLSPTEFGRKLIKESEVDKVLKDNEELFLGALSKQLESIDSLTAYDVQEKSIEVMVNLKDESIMKPLKEYAFDNALDIETILRLGGFLLRDEYLKKHPEITQ